jgi:tetratricopeptide (TPR) repeat protein
MDNLIGKVNDSFGAKIEAAFMGEEEEEDRDVIWLLATLALSKLGITLSVGINWSAFEKMFGWVSSISVVSVKVADVSPFVVRTVVFTGLLLLQPACVARMHWLSLEHRKVLTSYSSIFFPRVEMIPNHSALSPLIVVLFTLFFVIFVPSYAMGKHMSSGFAFILLGVPTIYLLLVNFSRKSMWQYVEVHCADVVKMHRYEQLCLKEGVYLLFLFVASYTFIMNFFIEYMATWSEMEGSARAFLVIGFMVYCPAPIVYLYRLITLEDADRTFRIFREQLVAPFNDKNMYMKLVMLVEAVLFSLCMVAFSKNEVGQLTGGMIVALLFCGYSLVFRPFDDAMDMLSDVLARGSVVFDLFIGLILADNTSSTSSDAASVFLIINALAGAAWFLYALDLKDLLLNRFFLVLQMYAQGKAMAYTEQRIPRLSDQRVKRIASSPIEFHVLSAVQRIRFATTRKAVFFSGQRIKELNDLEVTWLNFQHLGFDVTSLLALGFTVDELMGVDAQLDDMGDRSDIKNLFEKAHSDKLTEKGPADRETLAMKRKLGMFYKDMGEYISAMSVLQECLELQTSHLGATDADTLITKQKIGEFYTFLQRSSDAIPLLQECFDTRKEVSANAPETVDAMRALGQAMLASGLVVQARVLLEERLGIAIKNAVEANLREDHPDTLRARLDLGMAYMECGLYLSVGDLQLRRVMNRYKTMHGSHSRCTLELMLEYAILLSKLGQHRDALRLKEDSVEERQATLGPHHTATLNSKFALAETLIELGKTKELESLHLRDDLAAQELRLGETHPATIAASMKMGGLYFTMGKFEEALDVFRRVVDRRGKALGESHELTLNSSNNISACLDAMGRTDESKDMYEKTLDLAVKALGENHLLVLGIKLNLGQQRQRTGDFEAAGRLYNEVHRSGCEHYGETHPRTLLAHDFLGCLELVQEKFEDACTTLETVATLRGDVYDDSHPYVLQSMENIASCKRRLGKLDESLALFQTVCKLRVDNYGEQHIDTTRVLVGYALLLADMGHGQHALPIIRKCIANLRSTVGNGHYMVYEYTG